MYGEDEEFLAMAVPFAEEGITAEEPVLAVTTAANIQLLRDALGQGAGALDTADSAYFARRRVDRWAESPRSCGTRTGTGSRAARCG
ncbi:MEDS domain-containing protein [Streptomyces sp. NPDC001820]|uniref:MEDS domain-containing protein n=1 Tax=Streptomyces sp. NPDC001820 TaxID=3364613 RepID=UPI0036B96EB6